MKSILEKPGVDWCYLCGKRGYLETHHVIGGNPGRKLSERYGLKVHLCYECHRGPSGVHVDKGKRRKLQSEGQRAFETYYPEKPWMEIFGRNYREEDEVCRSPSVINAEKS